MQINFTQANGLKKADESKKQKLGEQVMYVRLKWVTIRHY